MGNITWNVNDDDMVLFHGAKGYRIAAQPALPRERLHRDHRRAQLLRFRLGRSYELGTKDKLFAAECRPRQASITSGMEQHPGRPCFAILRFR